MKNKQETKRSRRIGNIPQWLDGLTRFFLHSVSSHFCFFNRSTELNLPRTTVNNCLIATYLSAIYRDRDFFLSTDIWPYSCRFCLLVNCSVASSASSIYTRRRVPAAPPPLSSWPIPHSIRILPRVSFREGLRPFSLDPPFYSSVSVLSSFTERERKRYEMIIKRGLTSTFRRIRVSTNHAGCSLDHGATTWRDQICSKFFGNVIAHDDAFLKSLECHTCVKEVGLLDFRFIRLTFWFRHAVLGSILPFLLEILHRLLEHSIELFRGAWLAALAMCSLDL